MPERLRGRPPRRNQHERTAATRQALLDATVDCLVADGYGRTTTGSVTRRADVSVGALQHHFTTKAELMAAAVDHVLVRRTDEFAQAMAGLDPTADRLDAAVDVLWSMFFGPTFTAWVELWVAARSDPDLARAMVAVDTTFTRSARDLFAELAGDTPGGGDAHTRDVALSFAFCTLEGLAMSRLLGDGGHEPVRSDEIVAALKNVGRLIFPRPPGSPDEERQP